MCTSIPPDSREESKENLPGALSAQLKVGLKIMSGGHGNNAHHLKLSVFQAPKPLSSPGLSPELQTHLALALACSGAPWT